MSNSTKYLDQAESGGAAQEFLDKKLEKNKYVSGDGYNFGEGFKPSGSAYDDQRYVTNQDEIDKFKKDNPSSTGDGDGWAGHKYESQYTSGKWGKGSMSAEELATKFGLERGEPAGDPGDYNSGHIWGRTKDGQDVYIGKMNTALGDNSEIAAAHGAQMHPDEGSHSGGDGMSTGDINGALLNLWDGSGDAKEGPAEETDIDPIEHSPEIKQAKQRVKNYEEGILSGDTSNSIFKTDYTFDHTQGADGIGTSSASASKIGSDKATASFLDSKVNDVKKQYQFQAK